MTDRTQQEQAAPVDWRHRAEQAEELLRVAHETSNKSEAERARAVQRAEQAEAFIAFVADTIADHEGDEWADHSATTAIRAAITRHATGQHPGPEETDTTDDIGPAKPGVPRCTATWNNGRFGIFTCWRAATHNRDEYVLHAGESEKGWRFSWLDRDRGAVPHRPEETDTTPAELTAEEARDLADELGTDLYRAQDRLAFIAECLDAAEEGGSNAVEIKRVRLWLDGPKCGMQLAAENPGLYEKITAMVSGPLPSPDATRTTPAATEATSAPDTITDPEWLKQQYAAAIRAVWEGWITDWASVDIPDPEGVLADAVLRVRDRHVQQLRQRLALAAELAGTVQAAKQRYAAEQDKPADGEVSVLEQLGYHAMGQALDLERVQAERDQLAKLLTVILGEFRNLPGTHTATAHVETETLNRWRAELDQHQEQP